jgi:quercetin dioxygenase-like cupin family protein
MIGSVCLKSKQRQWEDGSTTFVQSYRGEVKTENVVATNVVFEAKESFEKHSSA